MNYIKSDGTLTGIHGFAKGRITSDGRIVDNVGNTLVGSADDLERVIENLNN